MTRNPSAPGCHASPRRVAIFRALALGDLMCAVPALRAMRRAWPDAEFTLIGLPGAREWSVRFSTYIDRFVEFPGWPGLPERVPQLARIPSFLNEMHAEQFDQVIQLHGSGTIVNSLVALFGGRQTAGFYPPGYYCPSPETFSLWPEQGLEIHRLLTLVDRLGLPRAGDALDFPLAGDDFSRLDRLCALPDRYVVVHPGASTPLRRWPVERFAAVSERLAEAGHELIITGVASERPLADEFAALMTRPVVNLCGQTDLGTLGALVSGAALVFCNDTGISHLAAALQTPSVVISTGENPARWAPIDRRLHRVLCRAEGVAVEEACATAMEQLVIAGRRHPESKISDLAPVLT